MSILSYLKKGVIGFITVFALVLFGNVAPADAVEDNIIQKSDLFSSPYNVSLLSTVGEDNLISWMPPSMNKTGKPIDHYLVQVSSNGGVNWAQATVDGDSNKAILKIPAPAEGQRFVGKISVVAVIYLGGKELQNYGENPYVSGYSPSAFMITSVEPESTNTIEANMVTIKWRAPQIANMPEKAVYEIQISKKKYYIPANGTLQANVDIGNNKSLGFSMRLASSKDTFYSMSYSLGYTYIVPPESYFSCPDIEVMTARGSGEPFDDGQGTVIKGTEEQTLLTNEQISEELPSYDGSINGSTETIFAETLEKEIKNMTAGYTVDSYAVPYPAANPSNPPDVWSTWDAEKWWSSNPIFGQSVNIGTEMVTDRITRTRNLCPATKIILSGYSQGALVMGNAIDALAKQNTQVDSVVLFGDPFFNPADMNSNRSNFIPTNAGMLADRDNWSSVTSSPVTSYCHRFDIFCNLTNVLTNTWDATVPVSAAAISGGNIYGPHESYPVEWEPDSNRQAAVEGAWQAAEDLKMAFAMEN